MGRPVRKTDADENCASTLQFGPQNLPLDNRICYLYNRRMMEAGAFDPPTRSGDPPGSALRREPRAAPGWRAATARESFRRRFPRAHARACRIPPSGLRSPEGSRSCPGPRGRSGDPFSSAKTIVSAAGVPRAAEGTSTTIAARPSLSDRVRSGRRLPGAGSWTSLLEQSAGSRLLGAQASRLPGCRRQPIRRSRQDAGAPSKKSAGCRRSRRSAGGTPALPAISSRCRSQVERRSPGSALPAQAAGTGAGGVVPAAGAAPFHPLALCPGRVRTEPAERPGASPSERPPSPSRAARRPPAEPGARSAGFRKLTSESRWHRRSFPGATPLPVLASGF